MTLSRKVHSCHERTEKRIGSINHVKIKPTTASPSMHLNKGVPINSLTMSGISYFLDREALFTHSGRKHMGPKVGNSSPP